MSLFPIFKVNKLADDSSVDSIYVFYGNNLENEDPNDLWDEDKYNKAFVPSVFLKEEVDFISKNNIEVNFLQQSIHIDDSIGVIKLKIFDALQKEVSMSELYVFCLKSEKLNPISVYQALTQNDKLPLTKIRLNQLLKNLYDENGEPLKVNLPDKEKYSFDDILKLDLPGRNYLVGKPLGQKFIFESEYPFIANPFFVEEYDILLENSRRELTSLSGNLLLETGSIFRNNIYLCLAQDVFEVSEINDISIDYTCKIYYPFLYQDKINSLESLRENRNKFIKSTLEKLTPSTEITFDNINMFYDVFKYKKPSAKFNENVKLSGINYIKVIMYPDFKIKIPIDVIFKLVHATNEYPLIKYNPESRQENIYRLFAPQLATDGRKIPYLQKTVIFKLIKSIGKNKSVAIYTNIQYKGTTYYMSCEFLDNGNIVIYPITDFENPILLEDGNNAFSDIDMILKLTVNPIIEQIKPFFEQSGLEIALFDSIKNINIEVRDIKYQTVYNISKVFDINKYRGCLSSVFTIESANFKKGIEMRYKRVSNFNKRDSQEAFIIEKIDQGLNHEEIIEELLKNFDDLNQEYANDLLIKIRSELEVIRGANKRRALMIKINPGFKTVMNVNPITSSITIKVNGINDIYYLDIIPVYLNTLIRITQDVSSTEIESTEINKLCSGEEIEDIEFGEITAQSEKVLDENEVPSFENETPVYLEDETGENMNDLLDILGFDDDEEYKGGANSDESESVQSEILSNSSSNANSKSKSNDDIEGLSDLDISELESIKTKSESVKSITPKSESLSLEPIKSESTKSESVKSESVKSESLSLEPIKSESVKSITPKSESLSLEPIKSETPKSETPKSESVKSESLSSESVKSIIPKLESVKPKIAPVKLTNLQENTVKDITGMKLKYPNPFSLRLEQRMPQLFVKSKGEKFDVYTRMCPFSLSDRRQPIILTKEEKDKMVEEHPDTINEQADFIEYGTDSKDSSKKFYYTCPRYWCLLTDSMVTEKDILDGKCGPKVKKVEDAIIPKTAEEVPKDRYVYQFYDDKEVKYPGFHKKKTPSGLCIPCCYNKWSTTEMKNRRDICQGKFDEKNAEAVSPEIKSKEEELKRELVEVEHYVKGPEKYGPQLGEHRWGFLPIVVQKFLHEVNEDCQISKMNMNLKLNHTCILRHGVEVNSNQSFVACIASAIFYGQRDETSKAQLIKKYIPDAKHEVPTIKEMKEIIIKSITIDSFIKYQNADLVDIFADAKREINIEKYKNSKLYKKINKTNQDEQFIKKVAQALENFKDFLSDNVITIDYTYLWDLICMPNPNLFEAGINLIILEIPEDDATNNIELVCPTNHYSANAYDARKRSLILIKRENYFEPIYGYRNDGKRIYITKTFSEYDRNLPKNLRAVFSKIIKPTLGEKCRSFLSRPNEYRFKQAPILDKLIESLLNKKYTINTQILNFQGKVIGVLATNKSGLQGFVPCYPSSLTSLKQSKKTCDSSDKSCEYDFVYMNDNIWKSYKETLEFLKIYYDYEEPDNIEKVNCYNPKYFCRVVEDELITGFLSNTNQFIPIKDPIPVSSVDDSIKTITNNDMLVADINTLTNMDGDSKRIDFIKRIQLETNFYNVFRNTIRIFFNDYSNSESRKKIQDECNKKYTLYKTKLDKVIKLLHELVKNNIIFAEDDNSIMYDYKNIEENEIFNCIKLNKDKCKTSSICRVTNDKCTLILPKKNLVTNTDNEIYYYGRMADELIRYNRIKSFMFKPQAYLSFGQVKYNLRDNEIIILQDLLNPEFFENLIPADINKYAKYNTYDTAEPIITQEYKKEIPLDEIINPTHERDCTHSSPTNISSVYWKKCFPKGYKEIEYKGSPYCMIYLIIDLINEFKNIKVTAEEIKDILIEEYIRLTDNFTNKDRVNKIIDILHEEGQIDANLVQDGTMNFEQIIIQDGFIPVNFDLWILLVHFKIPSILISSKLIPETRYNNKEFVCYTESNINKYAFIIIPAMYKRKDNKFPEYKLIVNNNSDTKINITELSESECLTNIESAIDKHINIEDYLDIVFEKDITTKYKKKQKGIRDIEFEVIEEVEIEPKPLPLPVENKEQDEVFDIEPKKRIKKVRKIKPKIILEEAEEVNEDILPEQLNEIIEIEPVKKKKGKINIKVNPPGKKRNKKEPLIN